MASAGAYWLGLRHLAGNPHAADYNSTTISEVTPSGAVSTYASGIVRPQYLAFDASGNLYVSPDSGSSIYKIAGPQLHYPVLITDPVFRRVAADGSIGGTNNAAVAGINLTSAELARIFTASSGGIAFGDSSQTGNITFSNATPATTAGASTTVVQSSAGQIILDDASGAGTALNGNGGAVTITSGTGGIVEASTNVTGKADIGNATNLSLTSPTAIGTASKPLASGRIEPDHLFRDRNHPALSCRQFNATQQRERQHKPHSRLPIHLQGTVSEVSTGILTIHNTGGRHYPATPASSAQLNGVTVGTQYVDQARLRQLGAGATLNVLLGYTPPPAQFTIVSAPSVSGTFNGLADGDFFSVGTQHFKTTTSPTAVTLTAVASTPPTMTAPAKLGRYRRRRPIVRPRLVQRSQQHPVDSGGQLGRQHGRHELPGRQRRSARYTKPHLCGAGNGNRDGKGYEQRGPFLVPAIPGDGRACRRSRLLRPVRFHNRVPRSRRHLLRGWRLGTHARSPRHLLRFRRRGADPGFARLLRRHRRREFADPC